MAEKEKKRALYTVEEGIEGLNGKKCNEEKKRGVERAVMSVVIKDFNEGKIPEPSGVKRFRGDLSNLFAIWRDKAGFFPMVINWKI
jgi:hypothetical protein